MPALQLNMLLLTLGALQGIFLFTLLFKKRKSLPGYIFLAAYLGVMLLQVSMKIASKLWLMQNINPLYQFSYQLPFLYGPLLYLFVCRVTNQRKRKSSDILHFLPGILFTSLYIIASLYNGIPEIFYILFNRKSTGLLQVLHLGVYHMFALYVLNKYKTQSSQRFIFPATVRMQWLRQLTVISMIVCTFVSVIICLMYYNHPQWSNVRFGFISLTVFIYWISYKAWSQPELFTVIRGYLNDESIPLPAPVLTVHLPAKKYSNSGLGEDEMRQIITALENKMQEEKLYLNAELTIDQLAESIPCSRHHLSQAVNEQLDKSFYDYINGYRVEEAKFLLKDPSKSAHKIASLAYDSGFNSISTFNDVFKKITGQTPSQYRKQVEEKTRQRQRV